ncbi:Hypothetical protein, putative [Bodo saltans]|uniref:Uncharacterized protein n=1 Tax=Bodo saltans TaxID=75058 RepID=A0A0S4J0V0_BODSA|nr:Hypothetical protein, putative [Bodo saltans]|eukprot:CUG36656.1 Hypothetical protein, putative [Bodo saltans]
MPFVAQNNKSLYETLPMAVGAKRNKRPRDGAVEGLGYSALESWPCRWDGTTLPYTPEPLLLQRGRCSAIRLYWRHPDSAAIRICVPNSKGAYDQLIAGQSYYESPWYATPVEALPAPPAVKHQSTQVDWAELPVPPEAHLVCFLAPT